MELQKAAIEYVAAIREQGSKRDGAEARRSQSAWEALCSAVDNISSPDEMDPPFGSVQRRELHRKVWSELVKSFNGDSEMAALVLAENIDLLAMDRNRLKKQLEEDNPLETSGCSCGGEVR